ncbi:MAG: PIN domain-containing protein, partial [Dehalococcoidia bacterium]|nr:PIN domain-containing protein [Dehalococcoidia bacterium]
MKNVENSSPQAGEYVLDSYALLSYFGGEPGSEQVRRLLEAAKEGKCHLYICVVNLGEVIYIVERQRGLSKAQETLARIDELPIAIIDVDLTLT